MRKHFIFNRIVIITAILLVTLFAGSVVTEAATASTPFKGAAAHIGVSAEYVRKGPGTAYDNVMVGQEKVKLVLNDKVTVLGKVDTWYHVRAQYKGQTIEGYSMGYQEGFDWIVIDDKKAVIPAEIYEPARVTANSLRVRVGASISADKAMVGKDGVLLTRDQHLVVLGTAYDEDGDPWYHIQAEFNNTIVYGYSLAKYIRLESEAAAIASGKQPTAVPKPTATPGAGSSGSTKVTPTATPTPSPKPKKEESDYTDGTITKQINENTNITALGLDYDTSSSVPAGFELVGRSYTATVTITATVTANLLNLREIQSSEGEVIAVLSKGMKLKVLNAYIEDTADSTVKYRWFKVLTVVDDHYMVGCVRGDYITLSYENTIPISTKYASQTIWSAPNSASELLKISKTVIKLPKSTALTLEGETKDATGAKWYHVTGSYNGTKLDGYVPSERVNFTKTAKAYEVYNLFESTNTVEVAIGIAPVPHTFAGADATVKGALGLALHSEGSFTSAIVLNSRSKPVLLYTGDRVELLGVTVDDVTIWCKVRCYYMNEWATGYVRAKFLDATDSRYKFINTPVTIASSYYSFEYKLSEQGFPESYKTLLREVHEKYPLWEFKAYHTDLDWKDVIKNETGVGVNLVPVNKGSEWKSFASGAYDWAKDAFIPFDGSTWVTASDEAVAYYMDPRNFLTTNSIFQFEDLTYSTTYQDIAGVENILKGTALAGASYSYVDDEGYARSVTYAETIMMAAEYTGVSPYHLASRIKQEITTSSGTLSNSVSGTVAGYENLFNFYNIGAYNSTVAGGAIKNGLKFAQNGGSSASLNLSYLIPWNTKFRSIVGGAYYIGYSYINKGQNTIYLEKFNVTDTKTYSHQYMSNLEAPYSEGKKVANGYQDLASLPIVFNIPVYDNMPSTPAPLPSTQYNPNNWIKTIKIYDQNDKELKLSSTFDSSSNKEYTLNVSGVSSVRFKVTPVSSLAEVISSSTVNVGVGTTKYTIKVRAENGDVRNYVINIVRSK